MAHSCRWGIDVVGESERKRGGETNKISGLAELKVHGQSTHTRNTQYLHIYIHIYTQRHTHISKARFWAPD